MALDVYRVTASFPRSELYGLTAQMRRCAVSISANIAEGCGRHGDAELSRFVRISIGSATELECHLLLARDLGWIDASICRRLEREVVKVQGMLVSFNRVLKIETQKAHSS